VLIVYYKGIYAQACQSRLPNDPRPLASFGALNDSLVLGIHFGTLVCPSQQSRHLHCDIEDCRCMIQYEDTMVGSIWISNLGFVWMLLVGASRHKGYLADVSGADIVANIGDLVVSRGAYLFVCCHHWIIVPPYRVCRVWLQSPTVFSSMALLPKF